MKNIDFELQAIGGQLTHNPKRLPVRNMRTPMGDPQFPGTQLGADIKQIRAFIKKQKRTKGFRFTVTTGTTDQAINISGNARILLGFSVLLDNQFFIAPDSMTLTVNNEVVIDQTQPRFFSPEFMDEEYYSFPRPLSGTDEITLQVVNSQPAQLFEIVVYYI